MTTMTLEKTEDYLVLKIPLKAVEDGKAKISSSTRKILDSAISEGLLDIESGKVLGPFKSVREFKKAIAKT